MWELVKYMSSSQSVVLRGGREKSSERREDIPVPLHETLQDVVDEADGVAGCVGRCECRDCCPGDVWVQFWTSDMIEDWPKYSSPMLESLSSVKVAPIALIEAGREFAAGDL